jgi:MarR family transcriptional regulator, organic hydroperoxide resistance regulator
MSTPSARSPARRSPSARSAGLFIDNQLCFGLYAASLAMTKVYRPLLKPLGLTYPQYIVMLALWEHGELSVGGLGERVALDSGTLVPLIRKLVAQGLAERLRSPADDRSVLISLTPAGARLRERAHAVHEQVACATRCTVPQRQALALSLKSLRAALLDAVAVSADTLPSRSVSRHPSPNSHRKHP